MGDAVADEIAACKGVRAALAVVTAARAGVEVTVADCLGDADAHWTIRALAHIAAGLLDIALTSEADGFLQQCGRDIAADLAAAELREEA